MVAIHMEVDIIVTTGGDRTIERSIRERSEGIADPKHDSWRGREGRGDREDCGGKWAVDVHATMKG